MTENTPKTVQNTPKNDVKAPKNGEKTSKNGVKTAESGLKRTLIKDIKPGETVNIRGFVDTIRDKKSIQFIVIRDKSGKVQLTVLKDQVPNIAEIFTALTVESVVSVTGKAAENAGVKMGGIEILPDSVEVLSTAKPSPIAADSGPEYQMDYRWIDLREPKKAAYFKIQTIGEQAMREWLIQNGFVEFHTSKLTAFSSEGGADVFKLKYYGKDAYLTQSPQLFKQMAMAAGFEKFYEIGPQYRAEKSHTSRHCAESFALDLEISYIDSHHDIMDAEEAMLKYVLKQIETKCGAIMKDVLGIDFRAQTNAFPRITLYEAYDLLKKEKNYEVPRAVKGDLDPDAERLLCEIAQEKYGSDFIFITDFPASARAFYSMKADSESLASKSDSGGLNAKILEEKADSSGNSAVKTNTAVLTKSFDLLYKGLEITSGAQREHDPEKLKQNMIEKGINPKDMEFYTQFFEYGCPPHGGIGFGLARFFARLLDLPHIRDVIFLFRGPDRLAP